VVADGVELLVRVAPKASADAVEGLVATAAGRALKVRVRAAAEKGSANAAVVAAIARWLGLAKSNVVVAAGGKSRLKRLKVTGRSAELQALLSARLAHQRAPLHPEELE
jgi:uncharacterized protein YggU (UPF0235/DUF167 family)